MTETSLNYKIITECFLETFHIEWCKTLDELAISQVQLNIGHKLRPQICLWGYLANNINIKTNQFDFKKIAKVAVSIELIHKASIILDDLVDKDPSRHGKPAFHTEYTVEYTVLSALNMIALSLSRIEEIFLPSIVLPHHYTLCIKVLIDTISSMAKGALEELKMQPDDIFNNEKIHKITQLETSEIIGNSFLLGYYTGLTESPNKSIEREFKEIGDQCGHIFQVLNDLEIFSNPQQLEKHKGNLNFDLFSNRKNIAVASLFMYANKHDKEKLQTATREELLILMEKYKIVKTLVVEMQIIFEHTLKRVDTFKTYGLTTTWCENFRSFLLDVKKFAEHRL